jgi:hypothetical protein
VSIAANRAASSSCVNFLLVAGVVAPVVADIVASKEETKLNRLANMKIVLFIESLKE